MEKVCVIGNLNVDLVMGSLNHAPEWGKEKMVEYCQLRVSGQVGYVASALASLGVEVNVIANVGDDYYGKFILEKMKKSKINTEGIAKVKGSSTGITVSLVNTEGERALISYLGSMEYFNEKDIRKSWRLIEECRYIIFNGYFLLPNLKFNEIQQILAELQNSGKIIVLDTGWDPSNWPKEHIKEIKGLLEYTDIFLPNLDEAEAIVKNKDLAMILNTLTQWGPPVVAVKMGKEGCIAIKDGKVYKQPSFKVKVTDTTGAGDTFNAGFIYGLIKEWDFEKSLQFANALASLYIRNEGKEYSSVEIEKIIKLIELNNPNLSEQIRTIKN